MKEDVNGCHLCRCNNCGCVMFDENPQENAKKYDVSGLEIDSMHTYGSSSREDDQDLSNVFVCPNCLTDAYLMDL